MAKKAKSIPPREIGVCRKCGKTFIGYHCPKCGWRAYVIFVDKKIIREVYGKGETDIEC